MVKLLRNTLNNSQGAWEEKGKNDDPSSYQDDEAPNTPQMSVAKKQLAEHALFPGSVTENQMSHN